MRPAAWVTVEGINGVGKTRLARRLAQQLGRRCRLVSELTDPGGDPLPGQVILALVRHPSSAVRGHTDVIAFG